MMITGRVKTISFKGILEQTKTRYVLVRSTGSGHPSGYAGDSLFARLFYFKGSRGRPTGSDAGRHGTTPALQRHRLIYESPPLRGEGTPGPSFCKLYEIVPGARLVGWADPGSLVRVRLALSTVHGGHFEYTAIDRSDDAGQYVVRLPYSNQKFSPAVRVEGHYTLSSGEASANVVIPESAVLAGEVVPGPSLRSLDDMAP